MSQLRKDLVDVTSPGQSLIMQLADEINLLKQLHVPEARNPGADASWELNHILHEIQKLKPSMEQISSDHKQHFDNQFADVHKAIHESAASAVSTAANLQRRPSDEQLNFASQLAAVQRGLQERDAELSKHLHFIHTKLENGSNSVDLGMLSRALDDHRKEVLSNFETLDDHRKEVVSNFESLHRYVQEQRIKTNIAIVDTPSLEDKHMLEIKSCLASFCQQMEYKIKKATDDNKEDLVDQVDRVLRKLDESRLEADVGVVLRQLEEHRRECGSHFDLLNNRVGQTRIDQSKVCDELESCNASLASLHEALKSQRIDAELGSIRSSIADSRVELGKHFDRVFATQRSDFNGDIDRITKDRAKQRQY